MEYTPDVYDAFRVLDWDGETKRTGFVVGGEDDDGGERYTDVEMSSELIHPFSCLRTLSFNSKIDRTPLKA